MRILRLLCLAPMMALPYTVVGVFAAGARLGGREPLDGFVAPLLYVVGLPLFLAILRSQSRLPAVVLPGLPVTPRERTAANAILALGSAAVGGATYAGHVALFFALDPVSRHAFGGPVTPLNVALGCVIVPASDAIANTRWPWSVRLGIPAGWIGLVVLLSSAAATPVGGSILVFGIGCVGAAAVLWPGEQGASEFPKFPALPALPLVMLGPGSRPGDPWLQRRLLLDTLGRTLVWVGTAGLCSALAAAYLALRSENGVRMFLTSFVFSAMVWGWYAVTFDRLHLRQVLPVDGRTLGRIRALRTAVVLTAVFAAILLFYATRGDREGVLVSMLAFASLAPAAVGISATGLDGALRPRLWGAFALAILGQISGVLPLLLGWHERMALPSALGLLASVLAFLIAPHGLFGPRVSRFRRWYSLGAADG